MPNAEMRDQWVDATVLSEEDVPHIQRVVDQICALGPGSFVSPDSSVERAKLFWMSDLLVDDNWESFLALVLTQTPNIELLDLFNYGGTHDGRPLPYISEVLELMATSESTTRPPPFSVAKLDQYL
jgi:hypothetical protein